jgi:hypothetical protein
MSIAKAAEAHRPGSSRPNSSELIAGSIDPEEWALVAARVSQTSDQQVSRPMAAPPVLPKIGSRGGNASGQIARTAPVSEEGGGLNEAHMKNSTQVVDVAPPEVTAGSSRPGAGDGAQPGSNGYDVPGAKSPAADKSQARLLLAELTVLESRCADLAGRLLAVVQELRSGKIQDAGVASELGTLRAGVESLEKRTKELAAALSVPAGATSTLSELRTVLTAAAEAEDQRDFRALHEGAVRELEDVLALDYPGSGIPNPLDACQDAARRLLAEIDGAEWPQSHPDCIPLVERRHAYSRLLDLVRRGQELSDEDWQTAEEAVANTLGRRLAVAAVRGRLKTKNGTPAPKTAAGGCPSCGAQLEVAAKFCGDCGVKVE